MQNNQKLPDFVIVRTAKTKNDKPDEIKTIFTIDEPELFINTEYEYLWYQ